MSSPRPGHWSRLCGCTYSPECPECDKSDDDMQAALRRQHAAAEACSPGIAVGPRRVCVTFVSDMKGLMQICGHAGPSATFNCLLCEARLNQTAKAGVPHLPVLPEPYKSQDIREADIINPPARKGTDQLGEYARAYAAAASAPNAAKELSSAEYKSCSQEPMIWSDDLSEHLSRTRLYTSRWASARTTSTRSRRRRSSSTHNGR